MAKNRLLFAVRAMGRMLRIQLSGFQARLRK